MKKCLRCGSPIDPLRLELLPNADTCVKCSGEVKKVGIMAFSHKTGGEVNVMTQEQFEDIKRLDRKIKKWS